LGVRIEYMTRQNKPIKSNTFREGTDSSQEESKPGQEEESHQVKPGKKNLPGELLKKKNCPKKRKNLTKSRLIKRKKGSEFGVCFCSAWILLSFHSLPMY